MAQEDGVCVFVPAGQDGLDGSVFGMGILLNHREICTCTHVIETAKGLKHDDWPEVFSVRVCFPFAEGHPCLEATVVKHRATTVDRNAKATVSDIAFATLDQDAPDVVNFARLVDGNSSVAVAYGFRSVEKDGKILIGRTGGWSEGTILGPLPGKRGQLDGIRTTGIRVQPGFSGAGLYCRTANGIIGMIVESSKNTEELISHYITSDAIKLHQPLRTADSVWFGEIIGGEPFVNREHFRKLVQDLLVKNANKILRVKGARGSGKSHSVEYLKFLASKGQLNAFTLREFTIDSDYVPSYDLEVFVREVCTQLGLSGPLNANSNEPSKFRAKLYARWLAIACESLPRKTLLVVDGLDANDLDDDIHTFMRDFVDLIHKSSGVRDLRLVLLGIPHYCDVINHVDTVRDMEHCTEDDLRIFYKRFLHQHALNQPSISESDFVNRVFVPLNVKGRLSYINSEIKSFVREVWGDLGGAL